MNGDKDIALILALHKNKRPKQGGSVISRETLRRARIDGHNWLMRNFFFLNLVISSDSFDAGFGIGSELFQHITECVKLHDCFFYQGRNYARDLGHSTIQNVMAALRIMAYRIPADLVDDHLRMGER
jgi:hypothetical protein